jgi:hypothetical protein
MTRITPRRVPGPHGYWRTPFVDRVFGDAPFELPCGGGGGAGIISSRRSGVQRREVRGVILGGRVVQRECVVVETRSA